MIIVRKQDGGSYSVVSGGSRLKATLGLQGTAEFVNGATGVVHEVGGDLLAISPAAQQSLEEATLVVIDAFRNPRT